LNALSSRIASLIAAQGPLSIAQFMALALHDSVGGYYATREPFGRGGDFITAPEVSQMFGELLGIWIAQAWRDQGAPKSARLVELGPGRGTMMADALRAISRAAPQFLEAADIVMVENSPALRALQRKMFTRADAQSAEKNSALRVSASPRETISWRDAFDNTLTDRPLFLLANEFFDALPVRQYVKTQRGWCERMVNVDSAGELAFALAPVASMLSIPAARGESDDGAVYETSPASNALCEEIARAIAEHGGAALIIDYGHEATGFGETLQAVAKHNFAGLLAAPGEADLSAHVDFASLAAAAARGGANAHGPVSQARLLEALGIAERAAQLGRANRREAPAVAVAVDRLTNLAEMGALFKALAIAPPNVPKPAGF